MEPTKPKAENPINPHRGPLYTLRFREFRLFWIGQIAQACGMMMFNFTLGWLAFELTGSPAKLALVHLFGFAPQIALTLVGGVLADRWDARKLIGFAETASALVMFALGALTLAGLVEFWHLALASFLIGATTSIDEPARSTFFSRLLPDRSHLRAAVPLVSMAWGGTRIVAPSIAGFVIAAAGAEASFLVAACGISLLVAIMTMLHPAAPASPSHGGGMLGNFTASVRYVHGKEVFAKVILAALLNACFAMGYVHMLPVFAKDVLAVDARGLGILSSASGVGSITGLLTFAWTQRHVSPRNIILAALTCLNVALLIFAWSDSFYLSVALLAVAGLAHSYFLTGTQVILQTLVEENYRGRVMALFSLVWSMMVLSGFLLNLIADITSPRWALTCGNLAVLCFVWLSLARSLPLREVRLGGPTAS
ncbi:MAG: MFS transporter [Burkholderiales bacterium]